MLSLTSVNTSKVTAGQTGTLGGEAEVQAARYKKLKAGLGFTDIKSSMFMTGVDANVVLQRVENQIETGNQSTGNGTDGDLLSWDSYLTSNENDANYLYQSSDGSLFSDVNFLADSYKIEDRKTFAESMGIDAYDTFNIYQNKVTAYEFTFDGLGDGNQAKIEQNVNEVPWGSLTSSYREVDTSYWNAKSEAAGTLTSSTTEGAKSLDSLAVMEATKSSWLTNDMKKTLSLYKEGSADYYTQLYKFAIKVFDQAGTYSGIYK